MYATDPKDLEIAEQVSRIKEQHANTQEVYAEVCALLFFRYGITPTANNLYGYVKKGSMSAPAKALREFWENIRSKSRLRIEHPDVPESLRDAAGSLVGELWEKAKKEAGDCYELERQQGQEDLRRLDFAREEAESGAREARMNAEALSSRILELEAQLSASATALTQSQSDVGKERSLKEAVMANLRQTEISLEKAKTDFADELQKTREILIRAEERLQGAEKRALMEIEHERQTNVRLQKDFSRLEKEKTELEARGREMERSLNLAVQEARQLTESAQLELKEKAVSCESMGDRIAVLEKQLQDKERLLNKLQQSVGAAASPTPAIQRKRRFLAKARRAADRK